MKKTGSFLLALLLMLQLVGTAFATDAPLLISPAPNRTAEYAMQEGDIVFIPGGVLAGTKCEAYVMKSATVAMGEKVTVAIPADTDKADGTTAAAGEKANGSADRFWGVKGGKLTRIVGTWESTSSSNPFAYKIGYHDIITELSDTDMVLANNGKHNGSGNCAHNFSTACGEKSATNRYAECAGTLTVDSPMILDLRRAVVDGSGKAAANLYEVMALTEQSVAAVNSYVPNGTKAGGDLAVMIVVDYEAVAEPEDVTVAADGQLSVGRGGLVAINFNGGGKLVMNQYGCLDIRGTVTGKTEVTFATMSTDWTYVTAPSATPDDAFFYAGSDGKLVVTDDGTTKRWSMTDLADVGLKITGGGGTAPAWHVHEPQHRSQHCEPCSRDQPDCGKRSGHLLFQASGPRSVSLLPAEGRLLHRPAEL